MVSNLEIIWRPIAFCLVSVKKHVFLSSPCFHTCSQPHKDFFVHFPSLVSVKYSRTFHKGPLKISNLCGHLQKVVTYENLDHNGSKFCLISHNVVPAEKLPAALMQACSVLYAYMHVHTRGNQKILKFLTILVSIFNILLVRNQDFVMNTPLWLNSKN